MKALRNGGGCGMLIPMRTQPPLIDSRHYRGAGAMLPVAARIALGAAVLLMLAGCGSQPIRQRAAPVAVRPPPIIFVDVPPADPARANDVLIRAIGLVGTPYKWGGNTPEGGFDCSGLVAFVFRDMGRLNLPRTSRELAMLPVPEVRENRLAPGDLVIFGVAAHGCANVAGGSALPAVAGCAGATNHVGIYVGQGRFVHAPNSGGAVRLDYINGWYWREHYLGARRVLHP